ncbi:MAG: hypothetical protein H6732_02720 [Alphaproteobacteria bacterium]|nr:hypothetical protein [Alphaproteobacteria bacterium]
MRPFLRHAARLLPLLPVSACLLGVDPTKGAPNVPTLLSDPELLAPQAPADGSAYARAGDEVVVRFSTTLVLDLARSRVGLSATPMHCVQEREDAARTYVCRLWLTGDETPGPQDLTGYLVSQAAAADAPEDERLASSLPLITDFRAPTADCVLSAPLSGIGQTVMLSVTPAEDLRGGPPEVTVRPSDMDVRLVNGLSKPYLYALTGPSVERTFDYEVVVSGRDLAGNLPAGPSLCAVGAPRGTYVGIPPRRVGEPEVEVVSGPRVDDPDGVVRVGRGAVVAVRFSASPPPDPALSEVSLGTSPLRWVDATQAWQLDIDETVPDGDKQLALLLRDAAGNETPESLGTALRVDQSPPTLASATLTRVPATLDTSTPEGDLWINATDPFLGGGVSASLRVLASEPLGVDAPVLAQTGPPGLRTGAPTAEGRLATWALDLDPDALADVEGTHAFEVVLTDAVGNRSAALPVPTRLLVDLVPPTKLPRTDVEGRITLARAPWGGVDGGPAMAWVTGLAGSAETGMRLVVESPEGRYLASAPVDAEGAFGPVEIPAIWPVVHVRTRDPAGNLGPRSRVRDVVWTVRAADEGVPTSAGSPAVVEAVRDLGASLRAIDQGDGPEGPTPVDSLVDGGWVALPGHAGSALPSARAGHAMAYDPAREVVVLQGGGEDDTWTWDGREWLEVGGARSPGPRVGATLAYDPVGGDLLLFGGTDSAGQQTWTWDGASWWEPVLAREPAGRALHAMAADPRSGDVVVTGGSTDGGSTARGDDWRWRHGAWAPIGTTPRPEGMLRHAMVSNHAQGRVDLFGGTYFLRDAFTGIIAEVDNSRRWSWNGSSWSSSSAGLPRNGDAPVAYDRARDQVVRVVPLASEGLTETWTWTDGEGWTLAAADALPPPRADAAVAYDAGAEVVVLFGGTDPGGVPLHDTWLWDGTGWHQPVAPDPDLKRTPSRRQHHVLVPDPQTGRPLLFGGKRLDGACDLQDTWIREAEGWRELTSGSVRPAGRCNHAAATLPAWGVTLLFGGAATRGKIFDDTWTWNGATWSRVPTPDDAPEGRRDAAMAVDPVSGAVLLFGGKGEEALLDDSWLGTPDGWTPSTSTAAPSPRRHHAMAPDPLREEVVLFGGEDEGGAQGDTWVWTTGTWTLAATAAEGPGPRQDHVLAWDPERGAVVLHGGLDEAGTVLTDTWAWDGTAWSLLHIWGGPRAAQGHALAHDAVEGRLELYGGDTSGTSWVLPARTPDTPAHVLVLPFAAAEAEDAELARVDVHWVAGGRSTTSEGTTAGVELVVWDGHGWTRLDTTDAGADAPGTLCARLRAAGAAPPVSPCADHDDDGLLGRMLRRGPTLDGVFAVRTPGTIARGDAAVVTHRVAVEIAYRLPPE